MHGNHFSIIPVFQIILKARCFEGSVDVGLPTPSQLYHLLGGQAAKFLGFLTPDPSLIWNTVSQHYLLISVLTLFKAMNAVKEKEVGDASLYPML